MEVGPAGELRQSDSFPPSIRKRYVLTLVSTNRLSSNRAMLYSHSATVSCRLRGNAAIGYRRLQHAFMLNPNSRLADSCEILTDL